MQTVNVTVIGGGQAGLGMGYHLQKNGQNFLILDESDRTGDSWRRRWDSLVLFTPRPFAALPGMKVPKTYDYYPTRLQIADYFEAYAKQFNLPIKYGCKVLSVGKVAEQYEVETSQGTFLASQVVVANGPFHRPNIPACTDTLDSSVWQLHSVAYTTPSEVPQGDVLIVGGGNSGAQLAVELARQHSVTIATSGEPWFLPARIAGISLYWYIYLTGILNTDANSWISRYVRRRGDGIVGKELQHAIQQKRIRLIPYRLTKCSGRSVAFENGESLDVTNILWTTGFKPDYQWVTVKGALDEQGKPLHHKGVSPVKGLFWVGLPWQTRLNSSIINGVNRDARYIASQIKS